MFTRLLRGTPCARLALAGLALSIMSSCAYYNTFYLARRYYDRATDGLPYVIEKAEPATAQNYNKSIDYSKKVIGIYPKSKWVDDAYLLWARALIGRDDPILAMDLLSGFPTRFPNSPLLGESKFYLGVAQRQARHYEEAVRSLDTFLVVAPKHSLAPYAYLERSRALMSLQRPAEAAASASEVVERFSKSRLRDLALKARADARFATKDFVQAREDYAELGLRSLTDEERFDFLLREADCLEGARKYDEALGLLRNARSHEVRPILTDTSATAMAAVAANPSKARYGRLQTRIGGVHLQAGRLNEALADYSDVVQNYPRTLIAAEAQYRIGYAYETGADDFDRAREAYAKVKDLAAGSAFTEQAKLRMQNLERVASYRTASGDSLEGKVESEFLLAELYLLEHDRPDRAVDEYRKIAREHPGTAFAGKAINAEAWVLRHKLDEPARADSLLWTVVHGYPATEAQIAARDYLERGGHAVPDSLIRYPEPPPEPAVVDTVPLTAPPTGSMPLGTAFAPGYGDSLLRIRMTGPPAPGDSARARTLDARLDSLMSRPGVSRLDSLRALRGIGDRGDTARIVRPAMGRDTTTVVRPVLGDSSRILWPPTPADTASAVRPDTIRTGRALQPRPDPR